jgi:pimeloyl-ACP methyl ester carboxylesterase
MPALPNIVLVHGAWADGSCWSNVIERLQADGYKVTAPQLPETSLAAEVARVRHVLTRQSGPTILAGHSYGGQVITSLGTDAPNVVGLVYIAAFEVIPPDAERQFAQRMGADTIEVASGHCAMVSHLAETHERIVTAANAAAAPR